MREIIVTSKEELENIINSSVRKAINEQKITSDHPTQDKILSIQEATIFLNLAKQTLYGFTSRNEIPFIKRGKKLYFQKSDLENWLLVGKRKSNSEILKELDK